jgi:HECT-domain (ubiquitin-transferase)
VLSEFGRRDLVTSNQIEKCRMRSIVFLVSCDLVLPTSTCFNRLDLPLYQGKGELRSKLRTAITLSAVGFDMD